MYSNNSRKTGFKWVTNVWFSERMKREFEIYLTLRALSKQRVRGVLQPGNVWMIEKSPKEKYSKVENLHTCLMRGWIEPLFENMPHGEVEIDGRFTSEEIFTKKKTVYKLTDCGWNAIHRTHILTLLTLMVGPLGNYCRFVLLRHREA